MQTARPNAENVSLIAMMGNAGRNPWHLLMA
jgi:hypothetical protein